MPRPSTIALSPHGVLYIAGAPSDEDALPHELSARLEAAASAGCGPLLLHLGAGETSADMPPAPRFWRDFGRSYVLRLRGSQEVEASRESASVPPPPPDELEALAASAPPMVGGEYLSARVLESLWAKVEGAFRHEIVAWAGSVAEWLHAKNPLWRMVGRVCFHLVENRGKPERPFAFMATYTSRISEGAKLQHLPLSRALQEYGGDKDALANLLTPIEEASRKSEFLRALADSGEIFHPLSWTVREAHRFLLDVPLFEEGGVVVRIPDWWNQRRPPRPQVTVTVGDRPPSVLGLGALVDFRAELTLDGETLTGEEWERVMASADGLVRVKGKWVEVDKEKLSEALEHWKLVQKKAGEDGLSFIDGMRLLAGAALPSDHTISSAPTPQWSSVRAGCWVSEFMGGLSSQDGAAADPGESLKTELRPYQKVGLKWLWTLNRLRLGGCLADDMGLGKTVQVIALLLLLKKERPGHLTLLVAPASLLANWKSEVERFAPGLRLFVAHASETPPGELAGVSAESLRAYDMVVSSYASLSRFDWIASTEWSLVVLDEAQAIKNPGARQTRAAKALRGGVRLAMTGTPVENRLSDLWSLFDFVNPGLLGSAKAFSKFAKELAGGGGSGYAPLRNLTRHYILRRLKTDKSVIADLPDKTELTAWCPLAPRQAALYQQAVEELAGRLDDKIGGIQRRGVVLAFLMRFKQVCNHPSHWLGDGGYQEDQSGKFRRLREVCETMAARQEKALVFTQFQEMTEPLRGFLSGVFGRPGLVLHGGTPVKKRKELVDAFQRDDGPPFFVLSLKAGGSGLNLTEASHVVHFDRWWNPAVENQATDRAFRIGQHKNVLVHKFVCRGTVEEKIDMLIESKKALSRDVVDGGGEALITEMTDQELLRMVALDINSAMAET